MATSNEAKSSNLFKIFWEALIFLIKNWKQILIFIFLYFIFFLFSISQSLLTTPILANLIQNLASLSQLKPPSPDFNQIIAAILTDLREITIIDTIFFVTKFFFSTLLLTAALCFICMTYTNNKQPTLKELFSKFRKTWKGTMITQFFVTFFSEMGVALMFLLIGGSLLFSMNSAVFLVVNFIILIVAVILYLYLGMIWMLSVVVSVVEEEGIYGLAAIVKATELMKGRRWKGILIFVFMMLFFLVPSIFPLMHLSLSEMMKMVIYGIFLVVAAVVTVFDSVVITVFYFQCKKGDGGLMNKKSGFEYASLPTEALSDSEIP